MPRKSEGLSAESTMQAWIERNSTCATIVGVFLQFYKRARTINREFQRGSYADATPVDFPRCQTPAKRVIDDRAPLKYCLKWRILSLSLSLSLFLPLFPSISPIEWAAVADHEK